MLALPCLLSPLGLARLSKGSVSVNVGVNEYYKRMILPGADELLLLKLQAWPKERHRHFADKESEASVKLRACPIGSSTTSCSAVPAAHPSSAHKHQSKAH